MLTAHKIALDPNDRQATYFAKACGTARFAYNWALMEWKRLYELHRADPNQPKPTEGLLRRELNAVKRKEFPWMLEVTKCAPQMAIRQLGRAFENFFAGRAKYPVFRKKGVHDRFTITNDQFEIKDRRIRIPNLGWVRMRECLRFEGKILSATISRVADRWFASVTIETEESRPSVTPDSPVVGVDLGVATQATLSTGEMIEGAKPHRVLLKRLQRLSRSLSRKEKGSRNRQKAKNKLARLHARISNIRRDGLHKLTTELTRRFQTIGLEDLNVSGMLKNRRLARSISDQGFHEFKRQLTYKAERRGNLVVIANRWFASSKTCSACGNKLENLPVSARKWTCPECGTGHDRDVNAAVNLKKYAVSSTVSARGAEGAGGGRKTLVKPSATKRESNGKSTPSSLDQL